MAPKVVVVGRAPKRPVEGVEEPNVLVVVVGRAPKRPPACVVLLLVVPKVEVGALF